MSSDVGIDGDPRRKFCNVSSYKMRNQQFGTQYQRLQQLRCGPHYAARSDAVSPAFRPRCSSAHPDAHHPRPASIRPPTPLPQPLTPTGDADAHKDKGGAAPEGWQRCEPCARNGGGGADAPHFNFYGV